MTERTNRSAATRRHHWWRWIAWPLGSVGALVLLMLLAIILSPDPGTRLIRDVFDKGTVQTAKALAAHAPEGVAAITNQQYRDGDKDAYLDVYFPETVAQTGDRLPVLVWTHGGGWVSGDKTNVAPYFQLIAKEGYTVVALNYSLAPGKTFPTPLHQVNAALGYIQEQADRFHADPDRIVIAGDSAGANITSQVAAFITNPAYAADLGIDPTLRPEQLRGVVLYCGIYDMAAFLASADGPHAGALGWGTREIVWAYTGSRAQESPTLTQMSSIDHVTAAYPPAFISGGNGDPLTDAQSRPLAATLEGLGVDVTTLFFPADHQPALPHEYQFNLDIPDGQHALAEMLAFLERNTRP